MRSPQSEAMRAWPLSTAGIEEAPGKVRPMASTIEVIVEAVPMVLQVPTERVIRTESGSRVTVENRKGLDGAAILTALREAAAKVEAELAEPGDGQAPA